MFVIFWFESIAIPLMSLKSSLLQSTWSILDWSSFLTCVMAVVFGCLALKASAIWRLDVICIHNSASAELGVGVFPVRFLSMVGSGATLKSPMIYTAHPKVLALWTSVTSSDSQAWYLTRFSGECVGAVGAYTLKIVTYYISLPLVLPDPRNMD